MLLGALLFTLSASGQESLSTLRGTATDSSGAVMPGVAVTVRDREEEGPLFLEERTEASLHASPLLRPGGWLLVEVGGDQDQTLAPTFDANDFDDVTPWWDDNGDVRGIASRATGR